MGTSHPWGKPETYAYIKSHFPTNTPILDVGAGCGTYAHLLGVHGYDDIDAVEAFAPNIARFKLAKFYKQVYLADILSFQPTRRYPLVIFGDVLEHLTREEALSVLRNFASSTCIVSIPWSLKQDAIYGNPYEVHKQPDVTPAIVKEFYKPLHTIFVGTTLTVFVTGVLPAN